MARVICSKCGATAISKCPYCRNVFPDNQMEALLSQVIRTTTTQTDNQITVQFEYHGYLKEGQDPAEKARECFEALAEFIADMMAESKDRKAATNARWSTPSLTQFLCEHEWTFVEGEHSDIGCGHGKPAYGIPVSEATN